MPLLGVSLDFRLEHYPLSTNIIPATRSRHRMSAPPVARRTSVTMETIEEEAPPSRPTSAITINIGFFPTVPDTIEFGTPSFAISSSQYSQIEYENSRVAGFEHEQRVSVLGLPHGLHHNSDIYPDDRITIECADNTNIACQPHHAESVAMACLVMARGQLMHSAWFVNWFNSPHYLARAGMKVVWPRDPLGCWEMAKSYMEDGYDRFGSSEITKYVCTRFLIGDRFIVLVRLYKLARVLELFGLVDAAYAALLKMEHLIAPSNVLTLARFIFGGAKYCKNIVKLRRRCLKWIGKHYEWLNSSEQWAKIIERSVPELGEQWVRIKAMNPTMSHEQLKRAIEKNVPVATAIINALKAIEASPQAESGSSEQSSRRHVTQRQACTFTKLDRNGVEISNESQGNAIFPGQSTLLLDDADTDKNDLNGHADEHLTTPTKVSFQRVVEAEYDEPMKVTDIVEGKQSAVSPSSTVLQERNNHNEVHRAATPIKEGKRRESLSGSKNNYIRPIANGLPYSISEPLLTVRRNNTVRSDADRSNVGDRGDTAWPMLSIEDNNDSKIEEHQISCDPLQRGLVFAPAALREPDGWPLSDIPLRDPLLPVPVASRVLSIDRKADKHMQFIDTPGVTVFGLHRPGMGGSVMKPTGEGAPLGESRAGMPNMAKAREFLGINESRSTMGGSEIRSSMDLERTKLKKKGIQKE